MLLYLSTAIVLFLAWFWSRIRLWLPLAFVYAHLAVAFPLALLVQRVGCLMGVSNPSARRFRLQSGGRGIGCPLVITWINMVGRLIQRIFRSNVFQS